MGRANGSGEFTVKMWGAEDDPHQDYKSYGYRRRSSGIQQALWEENPSYHQEFEGEKLVRTRVERQRCTWDPPRVHLVFPIREGDNRTSGPHTCREPEQRRRLTIGATSDEVTEIRDVIINGEKVSCAVIESRTTYETQEGSYSTRVTSWVALGTGLLVYRAEERSSSLTDPDAEQVRTTLDLLSLHPR